MPAYPNHQDIRPAYVQSTDPGAVGSGVFWVDTSVGPPFPVSVRNSTDTGWDALGSVPGPIGPAGPAGPPGYEGPEGPDGEIGPQGIQGVQGVSGPPGVQGIPGIGLDGADGEDGLLGPTGITGAQGAQGAQGIPGIGLDGADGEDGLPAIPGPQGVPGPQGIQGIQGSQGFGLDGDDGEDGLPAIPGPQGLTGFTGDSAGKIYYPDPLANSDIAGMKVLLDSPSANAETTLTAAMVGTGDNLLETFASNPGSPGVTNLPAGTATRHIYVSTGADNQVAKLKIELYRCEADGTGQVLLRTDTSPNFFGSTIQDEIWNLTDSTNFPLTVTQRFVAKLYGARVSGPATCNLTVYFDGTVHTSFVQSTISVGSTGPIGPSGPQGLPGSDGEDGDIGPIGPAGPQGVQGIQGSQGIQGIPGIGLDGSDGEDGIPAIPGATGSQGIQGIQGIPGIGLDGADGEDGLPAIPGPQGLQGSQGIKGIPGIGLDGSDGEDGLPGVPGSTGGSGSPGIQGIPGIGLDGNDGEDGFIGPPGPAGSAGVGSLTTGTTTVNFGVFPGSPEATVDVAGQAGFVSTSLLNVWVQPVATADHSVDEHIVESITVRAFFKINGTFTIIASMVPFPSWITNVGYPLDGRPTSQPQRLFGLFTIRWAWSN